MISQLTFILRRRWPVLAALLVVGAVAGALLGPAKTTGPQYRATAVISASQVAANPTQIQQDLVEAQKGEVAALVATALGDGTTPRWVDRHVESEFDKDSYVATIRATAPSVLAAEELAKTYADTFVELGNGGATAEQDAALASLTEERDLARAALSTFLAENAAGLAQVPPNALLASQQDSLETALSSAESALSELQVATSDLDVYTLVNVSEANPVAGSKLQVLESLPIRVALGLLLGLLAAAAVIFVAERTNPRIDDAATAAALAGAPVIAMVPMLGRKERSQLERVDPAGFRGPYAESIRTVRAHLEFRAAAEERTRSPRVMVTSATPHDGKSTTAAFLALSFTEVEKPAVVIGGDLRRPTIHRMFGIDRTPGLTTRSLPGGSSVPLTSVVRRDPVTGVTVVPSGPSVENVSDVMGDLMAISEVAQASGQVVVLDTAPVRVANDAVDFLAAVDWVVVVVQAGRSTTRSVQQMMHTLRLNGAEVVGVVMVGAAEAADASRDYYSYYAPEGKVRRERTRRPEGVTLDLDAAVATPEVPAAPVDALQPIG